MLKVLLANRITIQCTSIMTYPGKVFKETRQGIWQKTFMDLGSTKNLWRNRKKNWSMSSPSILTTTLFWRKSCSNLIWIWTKLGTSSSLKWFPKTIFGGTISTESSVSRRNWTCKIVSGLRFLSLREKNLFVRNQLNWLTVMKRKLYSKVQVRWDRPQQTLHRMRLS